eukprot:COSAG01_NODE_172_length_23108_cov_26.690496_19_plen_53_part_00
MRAIAGDVTNMIEMRQLGNITLQCNGTALSFNGVPVQLLMHRLVVFHKLYYL